ncbi:phospholipase D family protein [Helicobacter cetorum]|uniref:Cardiolipin synthase n=1 Tax=Helicobacter cetorum (strain ATCC BAA-429 / MIT 00-7128) TaxID=182217 RepID=I0ELQ6_HELC0|nr:phospholipase D family protein [Helicobacter cetorum]AFI03875.1 cardiolipin synthase [Helicobacter cetorum MIT 00-7128]
MRFRSFLVFFSIFFLSGCFGIVATHKTPHTPLNPPLHYNPYKTPIGNLYKQWLSINPTYSLAMLLEDGFDALLHRVGLIRMSQKSIDIQTYIYRNDLSSQVIAKELLNAANRGVKVRILIDDNGLDSDFSDIMLLNFHKNIEVKIFNPYYIRNKALRYFEMLTDYERIKKRMHNKLFIVDNIAVIMGGRNIGDNYFDNDLDTNFLDLDALFLGGVALNAKKSFETYWDFYRSVPISLLGIHKKLKNNAKEIAKFHKSIPLSYEDKQEFENKIEDFIKRFQTYQYNLYYGEANFLADSPTKVDAPLMKKKPTTSSHSPIQLAFEKALENASDSVSIASSYFIPSKKIIQTFKTQIAKGMDIEILTNSLSSTDAIVVYGAWERYRNKLVKMGADVYEIRNNFLNRQIKGRFSTKHSLHSKTIVFDDNLTLLGSFNIDPRSADINTESAVLFHNQEFAKRVRSLIKQEMMQSWHLVMRHHKVIWEATEEGRLIHQKNSPDTSLFLRLIKEWSKVLPEREL